MCIRDRGEAVEVVTPDPVAAAAVDRTGRRLTALADDLSQVAVGLDPDRRDPGRA